MWSCSTALIRSWCADSEGRGSQEGYIVGDIQEGETIGEEGRIQEEAVHNKKGKLQKKRRLHGKGVVFNRVQGNSCGTSSLLLLLPPWKCALQIRLCRLIKFCGSLALIIHCLSRFASPRGST